MKKALPLFIFASVFAHAKMTGEILEQLEQEIVGYENEIFQLEKAPLFEFHTKQSALKAKIRSRLSSISYLIYEYSVNPSDGNVLRSFKAQTRFNDLIHLLSAARDRSSCVVRCIEPAFTKETETVFAFPTERVAPLLQNWNDEKLNDLLIAWRHDKDFTLVMNYRIVPLEVQPPSDRKVLKNFQVPKEILTEVKSFDQFQLLRVFMEERYASPHAADWDEFRVLLQTASTSERARLAAAMLIQRQRSWNLMRITDTVQKLPRKSKSNGESLPGLADPVATLLDQDSEFATLAQPRRESLKDFMGAFYLAGYRNCKEAVDGTHK